MTPAVIELRQYTLHPSRRDDLIALFEREFVETQEAAGMTLIGQFRDLDDPDRFVWLRGFPDMAARKAALEVFYSGPAWRAHREAANATMIDSDDVLLLRPLEAAPGFTLGERGAVGEDRPSPGRILAGVHALTGPGDPLPASFLETGLPALKDVGAASVAVFRTEHAANTFPALPVREGEEVLVWIAAFADPVAADSARSVFPDPSLQHLRLEPTARSRLHG